MATRLPYYTGEDDIYSRLMAQYAQTLPYYAAPVAGGGLLGGYVGGYDPTVYGRARTTSANVAGDGILGGVTSGDGGMSPSENPSTWDSLTPSQQAAFYAANPLMSNITQTMQGYFGKTPLGMLQNALVPNFVQQQQLIAKGIDPFGMAGLSAQEQANVNQALSGYLESSMNQAPDSGAAMGYDPSGFGAYGENVAPVGVEVGGPIAPSYGEVVVTDIGPASAATPSIGNDTVGFGSYGENVGPGADVGASIGNDTVGFGSYGENVSPGGDGGGGGGGGGKIICTKLYHLGKMPNEIFEADQAFGEILVRMHPETYAGYVIWAKHIVRWMSRDDFVGKAVVAVTNAIATPWSVAMAEQMGVNVKSNWFGRFLLKRGLQFCAFVGGMTKKKGLQNV